MIRKLQNRFIRIAVLVLTAAMVTVVVVIVNTANLISVPRRGAGRRRLGLDDGKEPAFPQSCQRIRLVHRAYRRGRRRSGTVGDSGPG